MRVARVPAARGSDLLGRAARGSDLLGDAAKFCTVTTDAGAVIGRGGTKLAVGIGRAGSAGGRNRLSPPLVLDAGRR